MFILYIDHYKCCYPESFVSFVLEALCHRVFRIVFSSVGSVIFCVVIILSNEILFQLHILSLNAVITVNIASLHSLLLMSFSREFVLVLFYVNKESGLKMESGFHHLQSYLYIKSIHHLVDTGLCIIFVCRLCQLFLHKMSI